LTKKVRSKRFLEKPTWVKFSSDTVNTGIYVHGTEVFDYVEADVSVELVRRMSFPS